MKKGIAFTAGLFGILLAFVAILNIGTIVNPGGTNTGDQTVPVNTTSTGSQWFSAYNSTTGAFTKAQPAFSDLSGSIAGAQIPSSTITLSKMADMATASLIYRKTAATGAPEVNSLATLKTDLGLTGTNSGDQDLSALALKATTISTTSPLTGGGDLSANRTFAIADAAADGTTKGASTYTASDFNATAGLISLDYTNGQAATGSVKGFLTSADWTTFNAKESALTFSTGLTRSTNTITVNTSQNIATLSNLTTNGFVKTGGAAGTLSVDTTAYLTTDTKWDGGATGLVASTGRTSLGGTTVGQNIFTLTNPSAITFLKIAADNSVTAESASTYRTSLGLGTLATQNGTFSGTSSGTNTGDQTITLTGGVTGTGTGSFAATVITNANLTGDVTSSGNATTLANIPTAVPAAGSIIHTNIAAPASPAAGKDTIFTDSTDLRFHDKNASGVIGTTVVADTGASNNFLTAISVAGAVSKAQPAFSNLSGSVAAAQMPALTGDVTTSAGAVATTIGSTKVTSAMLNADVFSTAHSWGGVQTFTTPVLGAATSTSIATSAASPFLLTNGQLVTIALTSQTVGGTTLTIPDFASVADEFTFKTKAQTMSNKTFVAPALGTPASGVMTNVTGTASGLTAGNVTTNANLTGDVTSSGNATTLTNAPVIAKVLTGYTSGAGTVSSADSILQAIQKLNGNDALALPKAGGTLTGEVIVSAATGPTDVASVGFRAIPQNSRSAAYTTVLTDSGKHILHPSADTTARTFTIDSNANVAYPIGTAITFVNQHSGGVVTIAITTDTMRLAGPGTTGSRTLAADGVATAVKITSTEWIISGTGLN